MIEMGTEAMVGSPAPDFTLTANDGSSVSLADHKGQWLILFFYARDASPVCKRGCYTFAEQYHLFQSAGAAILGISEDDADTHADFAKEIGIPYPLLADTDNTVREQYQVPAHLGRFPSKSTFLVDPDGIVRHVYDWLFRPRRHVVTVLNTLQRELGIEPTPLDPGEAPAAEA